MDLEEPCVLYRDASRLSRDPLKKIYCHVQGRGTVSTHILGAWWCFECRIAAAPVEPQEIHCPQLLFGHIEDVTPAAIDHYPYAQSNRMLK